MSPVDLREICGSRLAFLMIREVEDDDDEWCILDTSVIRAGDGLALDLGPDRPAVPFPDGLEEQILETPDKFLELLEHAPYYIPFIVQDFGSGEAHELAVHFGITWPGFEEESYS